MKSLTKFTVVTYLAVNLTCVSAHQAIGEFAESYQVTVNTSSTTIKFSYIRDYKVIRKFELDNITVERGEQKLTITKSDLFGIESIDTTTIGVFSEIDEEGRYYYIHANFGAFDPNLYGEGQKQKGGFRYVRLFFRDGKYTHRMILNGLKKKIDGSSYIEYITKKVGAEETKSFK